jgi:hypothetical protein
MRVGKGSKGVAGFQPEAETAALGNVDLPTAGGLVFVLGGALLEPRLSMIATLALLALLSDQAPSGCRPDQLQHIVRDSEASEPYVLIARSGRRLRLAGQDFIDPAAWRPGEPLKICSDPQDLRFLTVRNLKRAEALAARQDAAPLQIMNGAGFHALLKIVDRECPASKVRFATPAALLGAEEEYIGTLGTAARRRVERAEPMTPSGDYAACASREGASCPAAIGLDAIQRAGLAARFAHRVCARGSQDW